MEYESNDFKLKYLKYKYKYLNLFKQKGGAPTINSLKGINLFSYGSLEQQYLDPTKGYIYSKNYIKNSFIFGPNVNEEARRAVGGAGEESESKGTEDTREPIKDLSYETIKKCFHKNDGQPVYLNKIFFKYQYGTDPVIDIPSSTISKYIGRYLGYFFTKYISKTLSDKKIPEIDTVEGINYKKLKSKIKETFPKILQEIKDKKGHPIGISEDLQEQMLNVFHIILAVLWKVSSSKEDIKYYYEGLQEYIPEITIPEDFITDIFSQNELDENKLDEITDENQLLAIANNYFSSSITLDTQEQTYLEHPNCYVDYPDCGSISLRNFIKLLLYNVDTNTFDINILRELGAVKPLIDYFTIFNTDESIVSDKSKNIKISYDESNNITGFEENNSTGEYVEITPRNLWGYVTSRLKDVNYLKYNCAEINSGVVTYNKDDEGGAEETKGDEGTTTMKYMQKYYLIKYNKLPVQKGGTLETIPNMLLVIRRLFGKINLFSNFNKKNRIKMPKDDEYDEDLKYLLNDGIGHITFKKYNKLYKWNFQTGHYYIENINIKQDNLAKFISDEDIKKLYIEKITDDTTLENINLFYKHSNEDLIILFNNNLKQFFNCTSNYSKCYHIFNYIKNNFNNDEISRLYINIKKIDNLTNLQTLHFGENFDKELGNLLDNLTNLQTLNFGDNFDKKLGNSLHNLTNLQTLCFGYNFNKELGDSLHNLTNLQTLDF